MENSIWTCSSEGYNLTFSGVDLIDSQHEESGQKGEFDYDFFIGDSGERVEISVEEDQPSQFDDPHTTLYAHVYIESQLMKDLKIFNYADGTVYLDSDC